MNSDYKSQADLKTDVKRWLKAKGLNYKWLAKKCFVSEVTVYNWMAQKKIPDVKVFIIRNLMQASPAVFPSVSVQPVTRVILHLSTKVQRIMEQKALECNQTLGE